MQQTASGPQREGGNAFPTDRLRGHRFSLLTNHRIGDRPLRMEDVQAEQLRGAFRTVQPLAFSNRQLSVGRIRPYFSSSALFNAVTIAPSKAKSATLFQWSELFCKSVTERHKPQRNANKKRSPPDPHPLKVWRATFTPKQCARRRFKTPPALCGNSPLYRIAFAHSFSGLPRPEDDFQMNAFQSNKTIKPRVQMNIKHRFQIN